MGSLMAGWDSPTADSKGVSYQRNRSFTKGEIESYWQSKKRTEEEHLRAVYDHLHNTIQEESLGEGSEAGFQRSNSLPPTEKREDDDLPLRDTKSSIKNLRKASDWWTRSMWAFLNEPPVTAMEGPSYKYASQYHIADFRNSKT